MKVPLMFTSSGETPAKPKPGLNCRFLVKDKGAPYWLAGAKLKIKHYKKLGARLVRRIHGLGSRPGREVSP